MSGSSQRSNYRYMIIPYHLFLQGQCFFPISNENSITKLRQFSILEQILFTSLGTWLPTEPFAGHMDENKYTF